MRLILLVREDIVLYECFKDLVMLFFFGVVVCFWVKVVLFLGGGVVFLVLNLFFIFVVDKFGSFLLVWVRMFLVNCLLVVCESLFRILFMLVFLVEFVFWFLMVIDVVFLVVELVFL